MLPVRHIQTWRRSDINVRCRLYCFPQECIIKLQEETDKGVVCGLDCVTGEPMDPTLAGIYDNYIVKKQIMQSAPIICSQLLLVDEVIRAGMNMRRQG